MWKCAVCKTEHATMLCDECGFDGSMEYERYPTLGMVSGNAVSARCKLYANAKRPFVRCASCASTQFRVDPERFEMQCVQCGAIVPVPQKAAPAGKQIEQPPKSNATREDISPIRFDGLYLSKSNTYDDYLRFFPDGVVVGATTNGTSAQVANWLTRDHQYSGKGKYRIKGNEITFSLRSPYGVVDYDGTITKDGLVFATHSHINGHRGKRTYSFTPI